MIDTSDAWREAYTKAIVPETFVEIKCNIADAETRDLASVTSNDEAVFSIPDYIVRNVTIPEGVRYATLEENLWVLDGSMILVDETATEYAAPGYVSESLNEGSLTIRFPEVRTKTIPGLTITWSSQYGEYAVDGTVLVSNSVTGATTEIQIEGNDSNVTLLEQDLSNYDTATITVDHWNTPNRRVRIDQVVFGLTFTFDKHDLISYEHEQTGCVFSAEIPKNSVSFKVSNVDGRWNPLNPHGMGKHLSERQEIIVRYGTRVSDYAVEWIPGGVFYLTDWSAPSNGLEASFSARDGFEFMLNVPYADSTYETLWDTITQALSKCDFPSEYIHDRVITSALMDYHPMRMEGTMDRTVAEIVQMCANASCSVMWHGRDGVFYLGTMPSEHSGYTIRSTVCYSYPEVTLSKPLKSLAVKWYEEENEDPFTYTMGNSSVTNGEIQSVDNVLISSSNQAYEVLKWVNKILRRRTTVSGEFRASPTLDLYDIVNVETKYGTVVDVALTKIKYTYSGSFHGTFEGRVIS